MDTELKARSIEQNQVARNRAFRALSAGKEESVSEISQFQYTFWEIESEFFRVMYYPSTVDRYIAKKSCLKEEAIEALSLDALSIATNTKVVRA